MNSVRDAWRWLKGEPPSLPGEVDSNGTKETVMWLEEQEMAAREAIRQRRRHRDILDQMQPPNRRDG